MKKFLRQQANFKKRIKKKWKKPKGRHSKLREKRRGLHKMPSIGYKQKESLRKKPVIVTNLNELNDFKKGDTITLSRTIGAKKKIVMLNECIKKGINATNFKDLKDKVKEINEGLKKKAKEKKERIKAKPKPKPKKKPKKRVVVKKKPAKKKPKKTGGKKK